MNTHLRSRLRIISTCILLFLISFSKTYGQQKGRERINFDKGWRFAFGHLSDPQKDFNHGSGYFSYLAKAGYADGPAAAAFDDRSWRKLDLPHDWAVEQAIHEKASFSHGFKGFGPNFPELCIGWYRKQFEIPVTDKGRRINIVFDGIYRNSKVWVNGHYLGTQASGYLGFEHDITEYLQFGGVNTITVRADASFEEGWYYEGAGIYRHVWLQKTDPVYVLASGTYGATLSLNSSASVSLHGRIKNKSHTNQQVQVSQQLVDANAQWVGAETIHDLVLKPYEEKDFSRVVTVNNPRLWSIEDPYLHSLITRVYLDGKMVDSFSVNCGIRTVRFDPNLGFFLNNKNVKLKGTNNHQDHAGVGVALPDGLQEFRIKTLKSFGSNAYRCSHHPPTPELLDACDQLGMLVINENRLMGVTETHLNDVKALIERDRHHPSVFSWSIGNEEWNMEGNDIGAKVAETMQAYVKTLDTTRAVTAGVSGGWGMGISSKIDVMGYNYLTHGNTDEQHKKFPLQGGMGTEEGSTNTTRGIYEDDKAKQYLAAYDKRPVGDFYSIQEGWKYYNSRPYLAGMFIWTGFDYRGEPTPFGWPSVLSYFGMVDACGFPKDNFYYLRSWWSNQPTLHILPHWTWPGKEGQNIPVWVYTNCDEVELFLNRKSMGKKRVEKDSHVAWNLTYKPGTIEAIGYKNGQKTMRQKVETTGIARKINIGSNEPQLTANKESVALISLSMQDAKGLQLPTASNLMEISIEGPGKIIGVGNGDPTSQEAEKYLEKISTYPIAGLQEKKIANVEAFGGMLDEKDGSSWKPAFTEERMEPFGDTVKALLYKGEFYLPDDFAMASITFFYKSIGKQQSIYINGKELGKNLLQAQPGNDFIPDKNLLKAGKNSLVIAATPLLKKYSWQTVNTDPGLIQLIYPAEGWKRKLFNGLAQVIVQANGEAGTLKLNVKSEGFEPATLTISVIKK